MDVSQSVSKIPLVGPVYAKKLEKLGIITIYDLLLHVPVRYHDLSLITPIFGLQKGETVTINGKINDIRNIFTRHGKQIQEAIISDGSGEIKAIWFNQAYLAKSIIPGSRAALAGKVDEWNRNLALVSPEIEIINADKEQIHTGRLVPIYSETYGVTSKWLRSKIKYILNQNPNLEEILPEEILKTQKFRDIKSALSNIHFPSNLEIANESRERLAFQELFILHLQNLNQRSSW